MYNYTSQVCSANKAYATKQYNYMLLGVIIRTRFQIRTYRPIDPAAKYIKGKTQNKNLAIFQNFLCHLYIESVPI